MNSKSVLSLSLASAIAFGLCANATAAVPAAQRSNAVVTQSASQAGPLSAKQRGELTRQFVQKWGSYVQEVHGISVETWSKRMVPSLIVADPSNFRAALQRNTFEGAMAELSGNGQQLSDDGVITKLAFNGADSAKVLGALGNDLVYTPVAPCRIIDTRNQAAGAIAANSTRNFVAFGVSSFASQGGSATNCGVNPLAATAVAINLTAVTPAGAGYATAYPFGSAQPTSSSINYVAGAIVNNALIVQTPNPIASFDITLYTFASSHYVADIVGYFAPPVATALQCIDVAGTATNVAANSFGTASAPACTAGYTQVSLNCDTSSFLNGLAGQRASSRQCFFNNTSASATTGTATVTCCRVPGR